MQPFVVQYSCRADTLRLDVKKNDFPSYYESSLGTFRIRD